MDLKTGNKRDVWNTHAADSTHVPAVIVSHAIRHKTTSKPPLLYYLAKLVNCGELRSPAASSFTPRKDTCMSAMLV